VKWQLHHKYTKTVSNKLQSQLIISGKTTY